ncbi:sterol desaturase family protein [Nocardia pseudobrasiliensis]|uniref:Fatty acid hydroxylase family protein n=1 Tax=Nocardia pseudobrasiliensis TaxID=45979 RepID=A0A370I8A5_9NOCA|nr:sterol desaturase family protein [Nocardia pseudobrasiliensis]RDI65604.1 fatty acid hydroxylase family protein [Nocardia pseudobrasiliensis]
MNISARVRAHRDQEAQSARTARARLADAEAAEYGRRARLSLGGAFAVFARRPSPWSIAALLAGALTARLVVGDWQPTDALVPVLMLALFPFAEWVIHVCVLHWRPRRLGPVTIDSLLARKHREHHADPRDVPLVFIPWQTLLWLLPALVLIGLLAFPRPGLGLTFLVVLGVLGLNYEWTHYLIHTDYQPRSRLFKAVRRNHRLHHFKNEHFWFTVTTSGTADRFLRTCPDPAGVTASPTVKALHAQGIG